MLFIFPQLLQNFTGLERKVSASLSPHTLVTISQSLGSEDPVAEPQESMKGLWDGWSGNFPSSQHRSSPPLDSLPWLVEITAGRRFRKLRQMELIHPKLTESENPGPQAWQVPWLRCQSQALN